MPKSDPPPGGADRILAAYDRAISARIDEAVGSLQSSAARLMKEIATEVWRTVGPDAGQDLQGRVIATIARDETVRNLIAHADDRFQAIDLKLRRFDGELKSIATRISGLATAGPAGDGERLTEQMEGAARGAAAELSRTAGQVSAELERIRRDVGEQLAGASRAALEQAGEAGRVAASHVEAAARQLAEGLAARAGDLERHASDLEGRAAAGTSSNEQLLARLSEELRGRIDHLAGQVHLTAFPVERLERMEAGLRFIADQVARTPEAIPPARLERLEEAVRFVADRVALAPEPIPTERLDRIETSLGFVADRVQRMPDTFPEARMDRLEAGLRLVADKLQQAHGATAMEIAGSGESLRGELVMAVEGLRSELLAATERVQQGLAHDQTALSDRVAGAVEGARTELGQAIDGVAGTLWSAVQDARADLTSAGDATREAVQAALEQQRTEVLASRELVRADLDAIREGLREDARLGNEAVLGQLEAAGKGWEEQGAAIHEQVAGLGTWVDARLDSAQVRAQEELAGLRESMTHLTERLGELPTSASVRDQLSALDRHVAAASVAIDRTAALLAEAPASATQASMLARTLEERTGAVARSVEALAERVEAVGRELTESAGTTWQGSVARTEAGMRLIAEKLKDVHGAFTGELRDVRTAVERGLQESHGRAWEEGRTEMAAFVAPLTQGLEAVAAGVASFREELARASGHIVERVDQLAEGDAALAAHLHELAGGDAAALGRLDDLARNGTALTVRMHELAQGGSAVSDRLDQLAAATAETGRALEALAARAEGNGHAEAAMADLAERMSRMTQWLDARMRDVAGRVQHDSGTVAARLAAISGGVSSLADRPTGSASDVLLVALQSLTTRIDALASSIPDQVAGVVSEGWHHDTARLETGLRLVAEKLKAVSGALSSEIADARLELRGHATAARDGVRTEVSGIHQDLVLSLGAQVGAAREALSADLERGLARVGDGLVNSRDRVERALATLRADLAERADRAERRLEALPQEVTARVAASAEGPLAELSDQVSRAATWLDGRLASLAEGLDGERLDEALADMATGSRVYPSLAGLRGDLARLEERFDAQAEAVGRRISGPLRGFGERVHDSLGPVVERLDRLEGSIEGRVQAAQDSVAGVQLAADSLTVRVDRVAEALVARFDAVSESLMRAVGGGGAAPGTSEELDRIATSLARLQSSIGRTTERLGSLETSFVDRLGGMQGSLSEGMTEAISRADRRVTELAKQLARTNEWIDEKLTAVAGQVVSRTEHVDVSLARVSEMLEDVPSSARLDAALVEMNERLASLDRTLAAQPEEVASRIGVSAKGLTKRMQDAGEELAGAVEETTTALAQLEQRMPDPLSVEASSSKAIMDVGARLAARLRRQEELLRRGITGSIGESRTLRVAIRGLVARLERLEQTLEDHGQGPGGEQLPGTLEEVEAIAFGQPRLIHGLGQVSRRRVSG